MTTVFNRAIYTYRAIARKAVRRIEQKLDREARGVKRIQVPLRWKSEDTLARIKEFYEGQNRVGLRIKPRSRMFKGLRQTSPAPVTLALTTSQIKSSNRLKLAVLVAKKAASDAALAQKRAADAIHARGKRHQTG